VLMSGEEKDVLVGGIEILVSPNPKDAFARASLGGGG
jgi:hypothetical protein